ncbi:hypothetical protein ACGFI9_15875 [Micromonospora sp. NPDC048930]|uniref:hypothetical protein n=1 Tax=Micromonospora sp. NPDC048930 TaxID=3364261 RepID=UPI003710BC05
MTMEDERTDQPASWPPADELPGHLPFDRLDYGDAEQLAEMTGGDEPATEEPLQPVDEPIRVPPPYDRTHKRRNQRRLPT